MMPGAQLRLTEIRAFGIGIVTGFVGNGFGNGGDIGAG